MDLHLLRADSPMAVRHIDLCYDHTDSTRSALRLIYTLCPDWEHSEGPVELIPFTEGITNTVRKRQACCIHLYQNTLLTRDNHSL